VLQQGLGSLRGAIGTPAQVRDLCRRYEQAGVDQVIFLLQAGRNRHDHICESIELFAEEVMPEFGRARGGRRRRARRALRPGDRGGAGASRAAAGRRSRVRGRAHGVGAAGESALTRATTNGRSRMAALQGVLAERGDARFQAFVRRSDDRLLERTAGSDRGLR